LGSVFTFTIPLDIDQTKVIHPKKNSLPRILEKKFFSSRDDGINFMLLKKLYSQKPYSYQGQKRQEAVDICANNQTYL
jgi:hypothetical protein